MNLIRSERFSKHQREIVNHTPKNDITVGMFAWHIWGALGWHDIKQRYRRSILGPFWFTLNIAIMVVVLGMLYSMLLNQDIKTYLPFLAVGLVVWQYIGGIITEGCNAFIGSAHLIKQIRLPLTIHVCQLTWRNVVILLHSLPVVIVTLIASGNSIGLTIFFVPLALLTLMLHGVWVGVVLGLLCARFRDIPPIAANLVQVSFFLTPVMWMPENLQDRAWIANYNPFYHLIEIVRAPLVGRPIHLESWVCSIGLLCAGFVLAHYLMNRARNRLVYWL
jgi:lipopolysaccharide transport system permease protein